MTLPDHFEPQVMRRALAGLLSTAIHACLVLAILLSGGRHDGVGTGETSLAQLVLIEAPEADQREGLDLTPLEPTVTKADLVQEFSTEVEPPAFAPADEIGVDVGAA